MRIAIAHCHLRRGGVTRVIENMLGALPLDGAEPVETVVLSGGASAVDGIGNVRLVDGLSYRKEAAGLTPEKLAERMLDAAREGLGGEDPDLFHVHNHSLGKNVVLPAALLRLAERGHRLLLHIHDFAEDGRPENYRLLGKRFSEAGLPFPDTLYPLNEGVHYAALNSRDLAFLKEAGVPGEQCHFLPNPVRVGGMEGGSGLPELRHDRLFIYPTRGIRRKNLGELALWALEMKERDAFFATTLKPENPDWLPVHKEWERFAEELDLPVKFGLVDDPAFAAERLFAKAPEREPGFADYVNLADALVTTSVAEGFGLAFLEPFCFGKPLLGRNLPEITDDFAKLGLRMEQLYERVEVPADAQAIESLRMKLRGEVPKYFAAYGKTAATDAADEALHSIASNCGIDFGRVDEELQRRILRDLAADASARSALRPNALEGSAANAGALVARNRRVVEKEFSISAYGERLRKAYHAVMEGANSNGAVGNLDGEALLACFLKPSRFNFLRT